MDYALWILTVFVPILFVAVLLTFILGRRQGFQSGVKSQVKVISAIKSDNQELRDLNVNLRVKVQQLEYKLAQNGEWIEVPVILHGLSWSDAPHTFVQLNTKTLEIRASEMTRTVRGMFYEFPGMPRPVLGGPKWKHIQGSQEEILLLGQVYRWG